MPFSGLAPCPAAPPHFAPALGASFEENEIQILIWSTNPYQIFFLEPDPTKTPWSTGSTILPSGWYSFLYNRLSRCCRCCRLNFMDYREYLDSLNNSQTNSQKCLINICRRIQMNLSGLGRFLNSPIMYELPFFRDIELKIWALNMYTRFWPQLFIWLRSLVTEIQKDI